MRKALQLIAMVLVSVCAFAQSGTVTNAPNTITFVSSGAPSGKCISPRFRAVDAINNVEYYCGGDGAWHANTGGGGGTAPSFKVNATPTTSQSAINYQDGTLLHITNPSLGNIQFDFTGTLAQTKTASASKWLASYDASTGLFTQTQPAYTDLTGLPQLPVNNAGATHFFFTGYNSSTGVFSTARPACADLSDAGPGCNSNAPTFSGLVTALGFVGTGNYMKLTEAVDPGLCNTGIDVLYASSSVHRAVGCDNNGTQYQYVHSGADVDTNDQVTQTHRNVVTITSASSPYSVAATDVVVRCNAASGAITVNLPSATGTRREIWVKKTDSTANACTVNRAGSDTIDGATSVALTTQYGTMHVQDVASTVWDRPNQTQLGGNVSGTPANVLPKYPLPGGCLSSTVTAGTTSFCTLATAAASTTETLRQMSIPMGSTILSVCYGISAAQPASQTLTFTLRKNAVNTTNTVTFAGGAAASVQCDTTHTVSYATTDLFSVSAVQQSGASASATITTITAIVQ